MAFCSKSVGVFLALVAVLVSTANAQQAQRSRRTHTQAAPSGPTIALQLKDSAGHPVSGAVAAMEAKWDHRADRPRQVQEFEPDTHGRAPGLAASNANGELLVPAKMLGPGGRAAKTPVPVYIINEKRQIGAIVDLSSDDANGKPREVTLKALCRVTGKVESPEMDELGHHLTGVRADIRIGNSGFATIASQQSPTANFSVMVPAGEYDLHLTADEASDGATFEYYSQKIQVPEGKAELDLKTITLGVSELTKLLGKPAPELKIKEWKNGSPVTLAELRGHVVILDIWNYGCGTCIEEMPILFKLQSRHPEKDLTIIAIHDPSARSLADAYEKSAIPRQQAFGGREFPYRSALDAMTGGTLKEYGVSYWPTVLLIDRQGNLARIFHRINSPAFLTAVEELIKSPRAAAKAKA